MPKKVKIPKQLVDDMLGEVPFIADDIDLSDWTQQFDPSLVETQTLAQAVNSHNDRVRERELLLRVAAFRLIVLGIYQKYRVARTMTPRQFEMFYKRRIGKKTLIRKIQELTEEDINMVTEEWYDLYRQFYLG